MARILIVWEDDYFEALHVLVKRSLAARIPSGDSFPSVMSHTSRGSGNFVRYVSSTWRNIRGKGLPTSPGSVDHIVCVADGDRLHEIVPTIGAPPRIAADVGAWHAAAETEWQASLRSICDQSVPASTVHGLIVRWSKESVVLAGYDRPAVQRLLGIDIQSDQSQSILRACSPPPATLPPSAFSDSYRHPLRCLQSLQAVGGRIEKNGPEIDDAVRVLAKEHMEVVCARVPDIERLVALILTLSR